MGFSICVWSIWFTFTYVLQPIQSANSIPSMFYRWYFRLFLFRHSIYLYYLVRQINTKIQCNPVIRPHRLNRIKNAVDRVDQFHSICRSLEAYRASSRSPQIIRQCARTNCIQFEPFDMKAAYGIYYTYIYEHNPFSKCPIIIHLIK